MAAISEGGGVTLPTWFLSILTAALLSGLLLLFGFGWHISETVNTDSQRIGAVEKQDDVRDKRLDALENLRLDVAGLKSDMSDVRYTTQESSRKIDELYRREMDRGRKP